jgi:hypothetical protein
MQFEERTAKRRTKALRIGTVATVAAAAVLGVATPSWATVDTATLSSASGPSGGGNTLAISVPANPNNPFNQGDDMVVFSAGATCPDPMGSSLGTNLTVAAGAVTVISQTKLTVVVPSGADLTHGATGGPVYSVCVYDNTGGTAASNPLMAKVNAGYTVGTTPTVTTVSPAAASPQGGGQISITGTNLNGATVGVTIGGSTVSRTNSNTNATSFIGTIPPHAVGGPFPVIVSNSAGGSTSKPNAFSYTYGITVTPNTSPNSKPSTNIDVMGTAFTSLTFGTTTGTTPNDTNAHVYLVKGPYDPAKNGLVKINGQTVECENVVVISDNELTCTLYLAGGGITMSGNRTVTGATASGTTLTSATGNFGPGDVGMMVTGTGVSVGTSIVSVIDPTKVTLSKTATITTAGSVNLVTSRSFVGGGGDTTLTNGSTSIVSSANAAFLATDVGRTITGANIPAGTTIIAVTNGTTATLSQAATGTASGTYVIGSAPLIPVPNGVYTVTVASNGGVDVQPGGSNADPGFTKTVVSSGSTFTVSDY